MPENPTPTASPEMARDRITQTYLGRVGNEETQTIARARIDWLADQARGTKVLDLGCSEGVLPLLLARRGIEVTGVDRNEDALAFASELLTEEGPDVRDRVTLIAGDILRTDLPGAAFDTVVLGEILEHLEDPGAMLDVARGCLREGGRVLITTPIGYFPDPDHKQTFTLSCFVDLLRPRFALVSLTIVDGYIRFVGTADGAADDTWQRFASAGVLLNMVEDNMLELQKRYRGRLDRRSELWQQAREDARRLRRDVDDLRAKREKTLEDARRWMTAVEEIKGELRETRKDVERWTESAKRFESKCRQAEQAAKVQQAESDRLSRNLRGLAGRIDCLKRELAVVYASKAYRIGEAMIKAASPSWDTLRLPLRLWRIYREPRQPKVDPAGVSRAGVSDRAAVIERHRVFLRAFNQFADRLATDAFDHFVVMFGGTTYIQDIRANRPIRLTRCLAGLGVPVLFNYHRWKETEHIPPHDGGLIFQSPIDKTPGLVDRLLSRDLGDTRRVFVVSYPHPSVCRLINLANANGWATLYDCRDDWAEFEKVDMAKWYRPGVERYVVNNCDATCCVARPLQQKLMGFTSTRPVSLLPNAYDPAFLSEGYERRPAEQVKVGYFGHLTDRWFDWDALRRIASQRPSYRFEIIGHAAPKKLDLPPNVTLLGPKTHAEICDIAAEWRVGIIVFRVGRLADGVDPIKIYEYFGLGLPVVSFRMPQIADYPHTTTVESPEAFAEAIDRAVECRCDPSAFEAFLAQNTWEHRARTLLQWADEAIDRTPCEKTFHIVPAAGD